MVTYVEYDGTRAYTLQQQSTANSKKVIDIGHIHPHVGQGGIGLSGRLNGCPYRESQNANLQKSRNQ